MDSETRLTRRRMIRAGTGLATAGLLACCSNSSTEETPAESTTEETESTDETQPTDQTTTTANGGAAESNSVAIEPMGEVSLDAVPETWVADNGGWADMAVALGTGPPEGVWMTSRYHTQFYDAIPGVSVDRESMTALNDHDQEVFYEIDADLHVMDPNFVMNRLGRTESQIEEMREIGPFFGNTIFSRGYPWHDYQYYTLYEAFEKLSLVFQRTDRYEAFATLHEEVQSELRDIVPPESKRPSVAILWAGGNEPDGFYPYVMDEGTSFKQWRDLGVGDALGASDVQNFHETRGQIDYETLLDVDPEVLLLRGQEAKTAQEFEDTVLAYFEDHSTASQLAAVESGAVYQAGPLYQGPIINLLTTERAASQVYDYEGDLFDRERVGAIVAGEI